MRLTRPAFSARQIAVRALPLVAAIVLAGCATQPRVAPNLPSYSPEIVSMYSARPSEPYEVAAVDLRTFDPKYYRTVVPNTTGEPGGTIVVDTASRYLYLTLDGGQAIRYGVGIGREGFGWSGRGTIARKQEWPTWTPPKEMVERDPLAAPWADGMPPGPENPLGARALYIYQDGKDTLYRVHGSPEQQSIGQEVSSGCVRLLQQDIIDLFARVPVGTPIVVR